MPRRSKPVFTESQRSQITSDSAPIARLVEHPSRNPDSSTSLNSLLQLIDDHIGTLTVASLGAICQDAKVVGHIAVFRNPFLDLVLRREKTIESRLSITRTPPYGRVAAGDVLFLKEVSGPLLGLASVARVEEKGPVTPRELVSLLQGHERGLALDDAWIRAKSRSRYVSLFFLDKVIRIAPRRLEKTDRRGWVVLSDPRDVEHVQHELMMDFDCARGLHTIQGTLRANGLPACKLCGANVVDWKRLHTRNASDVEWVVGELRRDKFRNSWWVKPFDERALVNVQTKVQRGLVAAAKRRIRQSVGKVYGKPGGLLTPFRDGRQTPFSGDVLFYAQHAVATCCRKCIEQWHGIPNGRDLSDDEIDYLAALVLQYFLSRLAELTSAEQVLLPWSETNRLDTDEPTDTT